MDMTPVQQLSLNSHDILSVDADVNGQQGINFLEAAARSKLLKLTHLNYGFVTRS